MPHPTALAPTGAGDLLCQDGTGRRIHRVGFEPEPSAWTPWQFAEHSLLREPQSDPIDEDDPDLREAMRMHRLHGRQSTDAWPGRAGPPRPLEGGRVRRLRARREYLILTHTADLAPYRL